MPDPGDVIGCFNAEADKHKFHLCVCPTGKYLFLKSPKKHAFPGDFNVPCSDVPLTPTPEGYSIISCTHLVVMTDADLKKLNPTAKGRVKPKVLKDLIKFVEITQVLSDEDKEAIISGLADWI
jgi:hypothetical protein